MTLLVKVLKPKSSDPNRLSLTDEQVKILGIKTAEVKATNFGTGLTVTGTIQPNPANIATVSSRTAGKLQSVTVNAGDRVTAGQTLGVVDSPEIADAQATYSMSQANSVAMIAAYRQALTKVSVSQRQLSQVKELAAAGVYSQAPVQLAQKSKAEADSEFASVKADLTSHDKALARMQELFDAGIRSKAELEAAQLEVEQDKARLSQAKARVDLAASALSREQALARTSLMNRKELVGVESALELARLDLRQASSGAESARRAVTIARSRLEAFGASPGGGNLLELKSPIEGVVTEREASAGESVRPETILFKILNPAVVWVEGDVFEKDLSQVRVAMPAQITTDAEPNRVFEGRISNISATVNPETRAIRVRVAVPNPGGTLRPGMFVRALFVGTVQAQAITVPDEAVQKDAGITIVFVKEDGIYERREVKVGPSVSGRTEIKSGIKLGEQVVIVGSYQLKSIGKS